MPRRPVQKSCSVCGREFVTSSTKQRYCGHSCAQFAHFASATERFWANTTKAGPDECWEWRGCTTNGYGAFHGVRGRLMGAHRFSYILHFGDIPPKLFVCHRCDNRRCVNPAHLFIGTRQDNIDDAEKKGRLQHPTCRGERHCFAKLNADQVLEIRKRIADGQSQRRVARDFGVEKTTIAHIIHRKTWKHI